MKVRRETGRTVGHHRHGYVAACVPASRSVRIRGASYNAAYLSAIRGRRHPSLIPSVTSSRHPHLSSHPSPLPREAHSIFRKLRELDVDFSKVRDVFPSHTFRLKC